jgi:peptidoglycan/xylan/chitin deacetylase (PgdA/CDA1 family)
MAWTTPAASGPLDYPNRRYGNDHDRYAWSMLTDRAPLTWPQGDGLALVVVVPLQFFPLNPVGRPVKVPGNMTMPYPDLRHYTLRDYGNRVGIHRVLAALDAAGVVPTFAVNTRLFEREPLLRETILARGDEIMCHSWSMDTPHAGGLDEQEERELVARSVGRLRELTDRPVRGWLSPGKLNSPQTPDLIAAEGIEYFCDWVNDELPYRWNVASGELWSMPLSTEISDTFTLVDNLHPSSRGPSRSATPRTCCTPRRPAQGGGSSAHGDPVAARPAPPDHAPRARARPRDLAARGVVGRLRRGARRGATADRGLTGSPRPRCATRSSRRAARANGPGAAGCRP